MLSPKLILGLLAGVLLGYTASYAQSVDSLTDKTSPFPGKLFHRIQSRTAGLDKQLTRQTERYLTKTVRREQRLQQQLSRVDSAGAQRLFAGSAQQYAVLARKMATDSGHAGAALSGEYLPYVDSLKGSLSFLQQNPHLLGVSASLPGGAGSLQGGSTISNLSPEAQTKLAALQGSVAQFQQLQSKLQDADQVKAYIGQRKEAIKAYLSRYTNLPPGVGKEFQGLKQGEYYYAEQVRQYRQLLNDPGQMEKKALSLLGQLPAFRQFMQNNGQLAGLLSLPSGYGSPAALSGLQTRDQVTQTIQTQLSAGGPGAITALQQNLQSAQQQLDGFKDKVNKLGSGSGDIEMPDFKPNSQRTRTLWQRLEGGVNLQTSRTNSYYPNILDIGGSLGYRLTGKSTVGLGSSIKIGLGPDTRHVALTASGGSLRSFVDIAIKGSFSATGGLEYNHTAVLSSFQDIRGLSSWTASGLIGVTKTVSVKNRVFKNTKLQLLFDFLSFSQTPKTPPVLFRIGYGFN